jgi:single-strand DNA-binding protein
MSFSQLTILGNLTNDPEKGALPDGNTETSRFGVAVNRRRGEKEEVTFYRANFIGGLAKVANQYLQKGRPVLIVGEPSLQIFSKKDGNPGASIEVKGTQLQLLGGKPSEGNTSSTTPASSAGEDDIPF